MAPKKDAAGQTGDALGGFNARETKLLAAAFVASVAPGKIDYELMGNLTGNTPGSLQKMFPPVKKKAAEAHPSFATFIGLAAGNGVAPAKAEGARKRKAAIDEPEAETADDDDEAALAGKDDADTIAVEADQPKKGRGRQKKAKPTAGDNAKDCIKEEKEEEEEE